MNDGAARRWRRIGIVLSVLVFFPLGIFLWDQPSVNERVYRMSLESCYKLDVTKAREDVCLNKARLNYESTNPPSATTRLLITVAMDLLVIGFFWLFAWGCLAVVRWIHRGFAEAQ